jgi:hypothetical protein
MTHLAALIYLAALSGILAAGVKPSCLGWPSALAAIFLLGWSVLILTAQTLSLFSAINVASAYIALSIVIATATSIGLRRIPIKKDLSFPQFESPFGPQATTRLAWFLGITGALVLVGNLILAYGFLPDNADSISYRFPRVYWYFGQGSLMHFTNSGEPRPLYYPFNGALAYLPLIHFQLGPRSFSGLSLLSWLVVALTTYIFARDLGGPRIVAAATAWLIVLTPAVLIQSLSTNDEIIAAAPLLVGLYFLHRWYGGRQLFDALIGVIGVSISAGTKLHIMFYWPLLIGIVVMLAVHSRSVMREARTWSSPRAMSVLAVMVLLAAVFSLSFIAYNYASAGRATAWEFNDQILNKAFNWRASLQTTVLYASQVVLTPIADLHVAFDKASRAQHYQAFNRVFAPLFSWVDNGPAFMSAAYRFGGVNSPSAVVFNEVTVFIGFTWLAALVSAAWLIRHRNDPKWAWARFHLASLPVWGLAFAVSTRYIEGSATYLSYATIVAAPASVYAFAPVRRPRLDRIRWAILGLVAAAHCFFALDVFFTSSPRNLLVLRHAPQWPMSRGFRVDPAVEDEISRATNGVYDHTIAWEQPFWAFMAYHPGIPHFLSRNPVPIPVPAGAPDDPVSVTLRYSRYVLMPRAGERYLHVYSFPQIPAYGHAVPIHIPDKATPGLTWVGGLQFGQVPEWVFAAGNDVETRHPGRDRYIVLPFVEVSDSGPHPSSAIQFSSVVYGLGVADDLKFRYEMKVDGKVVAATDWEATPEAKLDLAGLKPGNGVLTVLVRNDNAGGTVYSTEVTVPGTEPLQLPAPPSGYAGPVP